MNFRHKITQISSHRQFTECSIVRPLWLKHAPSPTPDLKQNPEIKNFIPQRAPRNHPNLIHLNPIFTYEKNSVLIGYKWIKSVFFHNNDGLIVGDT